LTAARGLPSCAPDAFFAASATLVRAEIDGELETVDSTIWLPKVMRKDYVVGLNLAGSGPDPDQNLYLLYGVRRGPKL
jgi:hypothetical protein